MNPDLKLSIPKPCSANWDIMTPNEKGKFCGLCNLTVVDFTRMTEKEIKEYFTQHYGQKTCGRFNTAQLDTSCAGPGENFWEKKIEIIERKYERTFFRNAIIVLLVFISILTGCRKSSAPLKHHVMGDVAPDETMGEPKFEEVDTLKTTNPIIKDSLAIDQEQNKINTDPGLHKMGELYMVPDK